jgi:hypothetical protein
MTHIEQAIRDAVEKGDYIRSPRIIGRNADGTYIPTVSEADVFIDPRFWQALEKAKWKQYVAKEAKNFEWRTPDVFYRKDRTQGKHHREVRTEHAPWLKMMYRFIGHLADHKDAESFFASLAPRAGDGG